MFKEFGTTIKNARLTKDLSLRDLAELTGLDHSYIGRLEKNSSVPSRETVTKLAKALNMPEDDLMIKAGYVPNKNSSEKYIIAEEIFFVLFRAVFFEVNILHYLVLFLLNLTRFCKYKTQT